MKSWKPWLVVLCTASRIRATSPPVRVELRTSWSRPPFFVEMLETLASETPQAFFPILDVLTDPQWPPHKRVTGRPSEDIYALTLLAAFEGGYLLDSGSMASVDMNLALHAALPSVEAAYQFYTDRQAARSGGCESWVDWYGDVVCDGKTLRKLLEVETIDAANSTLSRPHLYPFDRIRPTHQAGVHRPPLTAVLYGSIESKNFRELHEQLYHASKGSQPHVEYIFRHTPPARHDKKKDRAYLSGYGVALDLKKMEYLALDDRIQGQGSDSGQSEAVSENAYDSDPIVTLVHQYPENSVTDYNTPLTEAELLHIGFQSAQLLYDSSNALSTLKQLSQNFPKYASAVARRVTVNPDLEEEIQSNHAKAHPYASIVWLNGVIVPETDMNPFSLLRLMKKERNVMHAATGLGLTAQQAIELLTHRTVSLAQSDSGILDGIFDASDRPEGGDLIVWWNDFENDARYSRWNPSLNMLLTPMYPGQLPNVKLNLFNIVLVLDLSQSSSISFITSAVSAIIARGFPYRFGLVPIIETQEGIQMARLFYWLVSHVGLPQTMGFLTQISQSHQAVEDLTYNVDWKAARSAFDAFIADYEGELPEGVTFDDVLNPADDDSNSERVLDKARKYNQRLATDLASASQGHAFVNGKHLVMEDDFLRKMQTECSQQLQHLQEQLYSEDISDEDGERMSTYFYDRPEAGQRRNKHVYPTGETGSLKILNLIDIIENSRFPLKAGAFVHPPESRRLPATTFVIADLDSAAGLSLVKEALLSMIPRPEQTGENISRFAFVHNPANSRKRTQRSPSTLLTHLTATQSMQKATPAQLLHVLGLAEVESQQSGNDQIVIPQNGVLDELLAGVVISSSGREIFDHYSRSSRALVELCELAPGEQALVVNGRVIGPIGPGEIVAEDIQSLMAYEYRKRIGPVVEALEEVLDIPDDYDQNTFNDLVAFTSSLVSSTHLPDPSEAGLFNAPVRPRLRKYQLLSGNFTKFEYGDNSTALLHFGVLLDPLSEAAQKYSSLLEWLLNDPTVFVELHVNPPRYKELPLKRFYRYNLHHTPRFDSTRREIPSTIVFDGLPEEPIYTLAMDVAPSWLVRPRDASHDLDNILLNSLEKTERINGVDAKFSLDFLVIEGHAREDEVLAPPRGLQLQLVTSNSTPIADTLVVANLGYHQFRAKPGVYQFEIRPGRGREIFRLASAGTEGWDSPTVDKVGNEITLMSFEGLTLYPRTARLPGMQGADVLITPDIDNPHGSNLMDKLKSTVTSLFGSKDSSQTSVDVSDGSQAEINIFTVASGLLYERFASIMILSVLRNTKSSVKFWFIENFLSPSFLEFIPHFAESYGFQYELVTYKWPSWLRAQKEKQRIIWAYKILFLDVLFPMDLKKVIFVDADQIVRADLKELVDLDLHGAPYGYTPMGDDNVEMEGFRFWKTGYWRDFLKGLPYHISALYVVDLVRFRQMAAGDILRTHYQQLSGDPNSLANLDQDLPNNLQREVPIFSLPEDWLWCETWCSKDRLHRAKTIDLCQNPLTKEPKLARAKHIPEWEVYDNEIASFARQLKEKGFIHSGTVDADSSVLADARSGSVPAVAEHDNTPEASEEPANADHAQEYTRDEL